mgnify:CR=1 FL=1
MSRYFLLLPLLLGLALGQAFYKGYCASCHMPDAKGIPGLYPPLGPITAYACLPEGRAYLVRVVLFGLIGPLRVQGIEYPSTRFMPPFGELLDDEGVALVLNDLLKVLRIRGRAFAPEEISPWRTPRLTPNQVYHVREALLAQNPKPPCP